MSAEVTDADRERAERAFIAVMRAWTGLPAWTYLPNELASERRTVDVLAQAFADHAEAAWQRGIQQVCDSAAAEARAARDAEIARALRAVASGSIFSVVLRDWADRISNSKGGAL